MGFPWPWKGQSGTVEVFGGGTLSFAYNTAYLIGGAMYMQLRAARYPLLYEETKDGNTFSSSMSCKSFVFISFVFFFRTTANFWSVFSATLLINYSTQKAHQEFCRVLYQVHSHGRGTFGVSRTDIHFPMGRRGRQGGPQSSQDAEGDKIVWSLTHASFFFLLIQARLHPRNSAKNFNRRRSIWIL